MATGLRYDVFTNIAEVQETFQERTDRIERQAQRLTQVMESLARSLQLPTETLRGSPADLSTRIVDVERLAAAQQRQAQAERQIAVDRRRADLDASRADVERLRAQRAEQREVDRRIRVGLVLLRQIRGENRAFAIRTQAVLKAAQVTGQLVDKEALLTEVQGRVGSLTTRQIAGIRGLHERIDGLNSSFGRVRKTLEDLEIVFPRVTRPLLNISRTIDLIALKQGALGSVAGGVGAGALGADATVVAAGAGAGLALLGAGAGIAATGAATVKLVAENTRLEQSFDTLSAITGVQGDELEDLARDAITFASSSKLGSDATLQLAEAFKLVVAASPELARTEEDLLGVTRASVLLSQASGDPLRNSIETVVTSLIQFQLEAGESARVVDVLAAGAKAGSVEIPQLGSVLARTGANARAAGVELEDLVAVIEAAAASRQPLDIIASSLRNIIVNLQTSGRLGAGDNIVDVLRSIRDEGLSADEILKLFGRRAITTGQFLLQNVPLLEKYAASVRESGVASEQARVRLDNLSGAASAAASSWGALIDALSSTQPIETAGNFIQFLVEGTARVGRLLTASVQGRIPEFLAQSFSTDILEERLQTAEERFGGIFGERIRRRLREALEIRRELDLAAKPLQGPELPPDTAEVDTQRRIELKSLVNELDEVKRAESELQTLRDRIEKFKKLGLLTDQEALRLDRLAVQITVESTTAFRKNASAREQQKRAAERYAESIRKLALEQKKADTAAEERIRSIERENEVIRERIQAQARGGEVAVAQVEAERRIREEREAFTKTTGTPVGPQLNDRIRAAVEENVRLNRELKRTQDEAKRLQQVFDNALENVQRAIGDTFTELFRGGVKTFDDLADAAKDIFARLAGELSELLVIRPILRGFDAGIGSLFSTREPLSPVTGLPSSLPREELLSQLRKRDQKAIAEGAAEGTEKGAFSGIRSALAGLVGGGATGGGTGLLSNFFSGETGGLLGTLLSGVGFGVTGAGLVGAFGGSTLQQVLGGIGGAAGGIGGTIVGASIGGTFGNAIIPVIGGIIGAAVGAAAVPMIRAAADIGQATFRDRENPFIGRTQQEARLGGASAGFAAGAVVSVAFPFLAPLALTLGPIIGGILGDQLRNNLDRIFLDVATRPTVGELPTATGKQVAPVEGPFGAIGLGFAANARNSVLEGVLETIQRFDKFIAEFLTDQEIARTSQIVQELDITGFRARPDRFQGKFTTRVLEPRARAIIEDLEGAEAAIAFLGEPRRGGVGRIKSLERLQEQIQAFFEARAEFRGGIRELSGEEIPALEQSIGSLQARFNELRGPAEEAGFNIQLLVDALNQGIGKVATDLVRDTETALLSITDPLGAQLIEQAQKAERRLANARIAAQNGANDAILKTEELNALERAKLIERATEQANEPLRRLLDDLRTGTAGGGSVQERTAVAAQRFEETRAAAFASPFDPQLRQDFADAARTFVDLKRELEGSSVAFFEARGFVERSLEALIATPLTATLTDTDGATSDLQEAALIEAKTQTNLFERILAENERLNAKIADLTAEISRLAAKVA